MSKADLNINGKTYKLPIVIGTEGEKGVDISALRNQSGCITLDQGYQNTGSCTSDITFIDGAKGILRYRGYPIEELAEKSTFVETAYMLIFGHLPNKKELHDFSDGMTENAMIHTDMINFLNSYPTHAHPMGILSSMVNTLSIFYPRLIEDDDSHTQMNLMVTRLISKIRTIAAFSYKKSVGEPYIFPKPEMKYCANFLNMMFDSPTVPYELNSDVEKILNKMLIIHADHEQNCSTSTVRLVGSSRVNLYSSICAGICALWGPLHGGANQKVIEMLLDIKKYRSNIKKYIEKAKDKNNSVRLMGFGHRVYKNYDPRARLIRDDCKNLLTKLNKKDPLLDIAMELEEIALNDDYFKERNLYPNVDFYSGIIYRALGFPTEMYTVLFAIGRMPGWIAQWKEMHDAPNHKIGRPRQIYTGPKETRYVPMEERE